MLFLPSPSILVLSLVRSLRSFSGLARLLLSLRTSLSARLSCPLFTPLPVVRGSLAWVTQDGVRIVQPPHLSGASGDALTSGWYLRANRLYAASITSDSAE